VTGADGDLVSLVIPVFNGERHLADALDSAVAQSYAPVEIIVVDDGSTDRSLEIAEAHPGVRCLAREHKSAPAARNAGVAASTGTYLAFLDADDMLPADKLERQVDFLRHHPEVDCVFGAQHIFAADNVDFSWMETMPEWMRWAPQWERRGQVQPMSVVMHRAVFDRVGPFDEALLVSDDVDWVLRATELGVRMHVLDDIVLHRRAHDSNISRDETARRRDHFMLLKARIERKRAAACE
jgi:glycosyltransferase involved in cell wall biosynthesis